MSDSLFAFILSLGGLCAVMGAGVLWIVPRIEARDRRCEHQSHPAE